MEELDDAELMARVRAGQAEPLALLFERHHRPLYGFLYRMTGHTATSEDLVQEVFLRVLRYASSFKVGAPFRPWFYRIARNVLADHGSRFRQEVPLEPHATGLCASEPSAHARLETAQEQDRLTQALAQLPVEKRELLLLSRDPDLSCGDLAELYGCSPGALKVRVHRALRELRAHFLEDHATPEAETLVEVP